MARIYAARQTQTAEGKPSGVWHYTVSSDEEGWCHPVGYCGDDCQHASAEAAAAHYREWCLDNLIWRQATTARRCPICGEWGDRVPDVPGGDLFVSEQFCEKHAHALAVKQVLAPNPPNVFEYAEDRISDPHCPTCGLPATARMGNMPDREVAEFWDSNAHVWFVKLPSRVSPVRTDTNREKGDDT